MTDFEKALEKAANEKEKNLFEMMIQEGYDIPIAEQQSEHCNLDFKSGALWARSYTVDEICKFVRNIEDELGRYVVPRLGQTEAQAYAAEIESHFKDRGGE